jgi:hypothetical protein
VMASKANKILTFPSSLLLDIVDIDLGEKWGGAGGEGEEVRRRGMLAMSLPIGQGGSDARRAAAAERGREKMAASWTVGVLALMAGGRDGGGGRTAAAMLPILHHGEEVVKVADGDF